MDTRGSQEERPYFFWDYDIREDDVRHILRHGTPVEKAWVIRRILEYARWNDIWRYLTLSDIRENFIACGFVGLRTVKCGPMPSIGGPVAANDRPGLAAASLTPLQASFLARFFATNVGQPFFLAGALRQVLHFQHLPTTTPPLTLSELQAFMVALSDQLFDQLRPPD